MAGFEEKIGVFLKSKAQRLGFIPILIQLKPTIAAAPMGVGFAIADFAGVFLNGAIAAPGEFRCSRPSSNRRLRCWDRRRLRRAGLDDAVAAGGTVGVVVVEVGEEAEFDGRV